MTTYNELADWIDRGLANPQAIEDQLAFEYPCSDDLFRRLKKMHMKESDPMFGPFYSGLPFPPRKAGFDESRPAACADILALALIGKVGDIELAYRTYKKRFAGDLSAYELWGELLSIPHELCARLQERHAYNFASAAKLSLMLRNGNL